MEISIDINKTINGNAATYFENAKKAKRKIEGARKTITDTKTKLDALKSKKEEFMKKEEEKEKKEAERKAVRHEWYEKFRWFISSDGFLVIGGRDATTNEILVKKHVDKEEIVFHTDAPGSPFVVIKGAASDVSKEEAAIFCASYSKAWKIGVSSAEVYSVEGEQVTKESMSGEYMQKGAFMVYGERTYYNPKLELAVGSYEKKVMAGPLSAIKKHCEKFVVITQGDEKISDMAKKIQKMIDCDLDEIIRAIPAGSMIKK